MGSKRYDDGGPVSAQAPGVGGTPEGARSAIGGATSTPGGGALQEGQRWSLRRKLAVVQRLLAGEALEIVSREIGVPIYQLEAWRDKALAGMETALKAHAEDPTERKLGEAQRRIGELTMEVELLRERCRRAAGPLARGKSAK
ncbi:MAG TPA: transposase [Hyphomonadaceae bacterium]|nr:transposase [Hyphomonadaceae bacterium]